MYHVATRRDLDDPATVAEFRRDVHGREGLRDLYLLTVADLSTTSPTAMTSWKARMLDEVLRRGEEALAGATTAGDTHAEELERRAIATAPDRDRDEVKAFLACMPRRYVLATPAASVVRHARVV